MNPNDPFAETPQQPQQPEQPPVAPVTQTAGPMPPYGQVPQAQQPPATSNDPGYAANPWQQPQPVTPQTPQPLAQFNGEYLDQIAPTSSRPVNKIGIFALIGGVLLAVIAVVFMLANAGGPDFSTQAKAVQGRINTLQTVADSQQLHLKESDISQANSTLSSALTTMNTDLVTIMKARGVKGVATGKVSPTKAEKAYADALQKKLDDSYQRGTLDRTYTSQMTFELTILRGKLVKLKNSVNSKSVTEFSTTAVSNVDAILGAYRRFTSTK